MKIASLLHSAFFSGDGAESRRWRWVALGFIVLGIGLRLFHFFDNRSLWEDELFLASSLIRMDYLQLATQPLDYHQRAPVGFLWGTRACVALFGSQEMALRLFPLICGVASLFAFLPVARHFLKPVGAAVAIGILAVAPPLVYHAVEVKQYGVELLATILALWFYVRFRERSDWRGGVAWGIGGGILIWFSFTSVFVLAAIGCACGLTLLLNRAWIRLRRVLLPFVLWGLSFGVNYFLFLGDFGDERWLTDFWERRDAFFPLPPAFWTEIKWLLHLAYSFVYYPLGLTWSEVNYELGYSDAYRLMRRMPFLPLLLLAAGAVGMLRQRKEEFALLIAIPAVAIAASALQLYPLHERLTVFLAPVGILLIAYACDWLLICRKIWVAYAAIIVLLSPPVVNSLWHVAQPDHFGGYKKSYQREAWLYLQRQYQLGDLVYVYWNDLPGWNYYKHAYKLEMNVAEGRDLRGSVNSFPAYYKQLAEEFPTVGSAQRVWIVYRHYNGMKTGDFEGQPEWYYNKVNASRNLHAWLQAQGTEVQVFKPTRAHKSDIYAGLYIWK